MARSTAVVPAVEMVEAVMDPEEFAEAAARRAQADRNAAWFQEHVGELYLKYRGNYVCVAGQQSFGGQDPYEVLARARAAHPDDQGCYLHYVPRKRLPRV
jgi:hypothetical protein